MTAKLSWNMQNTASGTVGASGCTDTRFCTLSKPMVVSQIDSGPPIQASPA
jgi:hypothetical protein